MTPKVPIDPAAAPPVEPAPAWVRASDGTVLVAGVEEPEVAAGRMMGFSEVMAKGRGEKTERRKG